jgi:hypothetical protein
MADIDTMSVRERTVALMRGSREKLQLGYTAENAAYSALRYERGFDTEVAIDDPTLTEDLIPYAQGFADGMADRLEAFKDEQPALALTTGWEHRLYVRHTDNSEYYRTRAYEEGLEQGRQEFAPALYPALQQKPAPDYIQRFPERTAD